MQRLRRTFAKYFAILDGEAPQFQEAKCGGNLRYGHASPIRGQKGASRLRQPQHAKMPARRKAASFVECLAKRSLAYAKSATQSSNVERLIQIRERQLFRLIDEITLRPVCPLEGPFLWSCDPLIQGHGNPR
jgi:hypothetical protein